MKKEEIYADISDYSYDVFLFFVQRNIGFKQESTYL